MIRYLILLMSISPLIGAAQFDSLEISRFLQLSGIVSEKGSDPGYALTDIYTSSQTGVTHVYLQQKHLDIPVYNGILNLNIYGDRVMSLGNSWIPSISERALTADVGIGAFQALAPVAVELGLAVGDASELGRQRNSRGQEVFASFTGGSLSREEIPVRLLWLEQGPKLLLCWQVEVHDITRDAVWHVFINAVTGEYVDKYDQVVNCDFGHAHNSQARTTAGMSAAMPVAPDSSYHVFAMPVESPFHGGRSVVTRPWLGAGAGNGAISLQWHDDGATNYTITRGNNVYAYDDTDGNNSPGFSPDTANLRFDYPFDQLQNPDDNLAASVTNLFYWNNIVHDVMYQYGFDEVAGNFQNDNLDRGGSEGDYVRAEAQDGGGLNNANFFTPTDGSNPRMQMYLWSDVQDSYPLDVNSPGSVAGNYFSVESNFSTANQLEDVGPITGDLVLVMDQGDTTHLACGTISNGGEINGKVAVIDRGDCDFVVKVKAVQDLGAIGAVVVNNVSDAPIPMGGTDNSITIPAVMMTLSDGELLKTVLETSTINVTLDTTSTFTPDGDFDNGIIVHEYGHGISTRLTGGPSNVNCLNNDEQMGEGWSDYFALMLTTDWSNASSTDVRGIGTYVLGEPNDGPGIRTYQYTTDTGVNPFTYADIADAPVITGNVSPHYVGSVWATMLWDMTWNIIEIEGADTDIYHGTGGNNIALNLVINGLKLQPCSPGFVDGRDAILLADEIIYDGQYKCAIWEAFADRGLGVNADQGSTNDHEDGVESYDVPSGIIVRGSSDLADAVEGQKVTFQVQAIGECADVSNVVVEDILSDQLTYLPGSGGTYSDGTVQFNAGTLTAQDTVTFEYEAIIAGCSASEDVTIVADDVEGESPFESIKLAGTGNKSWVVTSSQSVSPTHSWYADDFNNLGDIALTMINGVTVTGPVTVTFWHRYETEANYDGGVVEYSTNDGSTWEDAEAFFIENGYPAAINTAGTNSPIAGRNAFTGDSDMQFDTTGFVRSRIELPVGGGQSFKLRFRFATDGSVGGTGLDGWYIDDIDIVQGSGITNKTRGLVSGVPVDSMNYGVETSIFTGDRLYVDQSSSGDQGGSSWDNAIHFLPVALELAGCRSVDSVLLAEGRYVPTLNEDRYASFSIGDSTYLIGGFPTGGGPLVARNPAVFTTQLSGDIGLSDDTTDNVYHVVYIDSTSHGSIIDGILITGGNASGTEEEASGAALFNRGGITMKAVTIDQNFGLEQGQQIRNVGPNATLELTGCKLYLTPHPAEGIHNSDQGVLIIEGINMGLLQGE